jgi:hypothetical protein
MYFIEVPRLDGGLGWAHGPVGLVGGPARREPCFDRFARGCPQVLVLGGQIGAGDRARLVLKKRGERLVDGDSSRIDVVPGRERHGYVLQPFLFARKEDDVDPVAAAWRANSSPMPDEAPVTSAHGPYVYLSSCFMALLT